LKNTDQIAVVDEMYFGFPSCSATIVSSQLFLLSFPDKSPMKNPMQMPISAQLVVNIPDKFTMKL
jgi:hypothetical protein